MKSSTKSSLSFPPVNNDFEAQVIKECEEDTREFNSHDCVEILNKTLTLRILKMYEMISVLLSKYSLLCSILRYILLQ